MVAQHYRWDFIGLSTDTKPTPATSEKVVNGSTFYCSDTSKLYIFYKDTWYERKPLGGGGGGGSYTAGTGIDITDSTISVDTTTIQEKLTAGSNVTISDNTISATDTTYSNFTGTDGTAAGVAGLVPAPATTDAGKFLKADGTWDTAGGGSGPTVVQSIGSSTTDVMSQDATSKMVFADGNTHSVLIGGNSISTPSNYTVTIGYAASNPSSSSYAIAIGAGTGSGSAKGATVKGASAIAIGVNSSADASSSIALGVSSSSLGDGSVAIGRGAKASVTGQFDIGATGNTSYGYNSSAYRLLTGLYDGQSAHDAVTVEQVNNTIDAINTALSTNIPHIGAAS